VHCRTGKKSPFLRLSSERPAHPSRQRHGPAPSAWGAVAQQTTAVALHKGEPGEPGELGTVKQLWHTGHPQREELLTDIEQLCFILYIFIYIYISLYRQERFCPFYCSTFFYTHSLLSLSNLSRSHFHLHQSGFRVKASTCSRNVHVRWNFTGNCGNPAFVSFREKHKAAWQTPKAAGALRTCAAPSQHMCLTRLMIPLCLVQRKGRHVCSWSRPRREVRDLTENA